MGELFDVLQTYRAYLRHHDVPPSEIDDSIQAFTDVFEKSDTKMKKAIIRVLSAWGRDDYVEMGGLIQLVAALVKG